MGGMSIFEPESLAIFLGPILLNHLNVLKTMLWGALLVATNLLNTCIYIFFSFSFSLFLRLWRDHRADFQMLISSWPSHCVTFITGYNKTVTSSLSPQLFKLLTKTTKTKLYYTPFFSSLLFFLFFFFLSFFFFLLEFVHLYLFLFFLRNY